MADEIDINKLSARTGTDIALLRRLPDEKLSQYFNRTVTDIGVTLIAANAACSGAVIMEAIQRFNDTHTMIFGLLLGAANASLAVGGLLRAKKNTAIGKDIQAEIVKGVPQQSTLTIG